MKKILNWYGQHFLRAYEMEVYWPWQKGWWQNIGNDQKGRMQRIGSFLVVLLGVNLFFYSLIALAVLVAVLQKL